MLVDTSAPPTEPIVSEAPVEREQTKNRSDRAPTEYSVSLQKSTAATVGATTASRPDSTISTRSLAHVTDSGPADVTASAQTIGVEAAPEASTLVIEAELVPSDGSGADNHNTVVTQAPDTGPSTASTGIVSGLLSAVGVGSPLSTVDGPVQPLPGVILVGSLDLMRRDLERMNDDQLVIDTEQVTNTLTAEVPPEELVPVATTTTDSDTETDPEHPSWSVPDELTVEPTAHERAVAFAKAQAERAEAFTAAQEARTAAFNEQVAQATVQFGLAAIVATAAHVVEELAYVGVQVVTEFVHYAVYAVTEIVHAISDWFRAPAVFTGMYGNPEASAQYWRPQRAENCVLQSAAMMVGQLTGTTPEEADIAAKAMAMQSVVDPTRAMYLGLHTQDRVADKDAIALLDAEYGIAATYTRYEKTEGNIALRALAFALEDDRKAVSVGVQGATIWNSVEGEPLPNIDGADHQVVVTGIDFDERVVYLNDSGFPEQGRKMRVELDVFMRAWQSDGYETVIAQLKQPASDVGSHRISSPDSGVLLQVA
ncbi:hypothetical protein AU192_04410 [Mycobacterium lehmannii]|uniref:Peptidase C39-like domain-containing protein n=1 Tax=Mycobacterium lehmannii TaxID=2048550 RepID=A0A101AAL9_9MYCO|nr:hypothetical protein AU192_04410 [Mycobacterium lehmannii]